MKHYERTKSGLFLMELLLNLLLFCVLCCCGLMFFIKSNHMMQSTTDLHNATRITCSIAGIYESGDGSLSSIREIYTHGAETDDGFCIYFDENYNPCTDAHKTYEVVVQKTNTSLNKISIAFYNAKHELIYAIDTLCYTPSTLESVKEVPAQ